MSSRCLDLILAAVVAALALAAALAGLNHNVIRVALGLPLALILPGYALTAALFPRRTPGLAEGALFALSLSMVASAVGGLVLNLFPGGLGVTGWAVYLAGITWVGALAAYARRRRLHLPAPGVARPLFAPPTIAWPQAVMLGLALVAVGLAVSVARVGALSQPESDFTQLWILPASPTDSSVLRVGVHNQEAAAVTYRLQLVSGERILGEWPSITLKPGDTWEMLPVLPGDLPTTQPVRVVLYRTEQPDTIYRQGLFWRDRS